MGKWMKTTDYRRDFPLLMQETAAYLDNAATAQRPQCVLDAEKISGMEELLKFVLLLAFVGFGTKAAVFPMYAWLPAASVAPTP